jgi:branched-chain amino acid transport system permease protein
MRRLLGRRETAWVAAVLAACVALAFLPLAVPRDDILNLVFLILLSITLAESWNIVAGYAGQVNLGHAAFFGLGALGARALCFRGVPILVAMGVGAVTAVAFALIIGVAAFRLWGAYFAIGTLALGDFCDHGR